MLFLDKIIAKKREEVKQLKASNALVKLKAELNEVNPCVDAIAQLKETQAPAIIAEIKRASPSKGLIREDLDIIKCAKEYAAAGASCISILTDKEFFKGDLSFLRDVRRAIANIPLLRKDFIVDPIQVWQSRAAGADIILLIVAALEIGELEELKNEADEVGLTCLIEVHSQSELETACSLLKDFSRDFILGVNSRDLKSFKTNTRDAKKVISNFINMRNSNSILKGIPIVAESGLSTAEDLYQMQAAGAEAFLIGESLVKEGSPGVNLRQLISDFQNS